MGAGQGLLSWVLQGEEEFTWQRKEGSGLRLSAFAEERAWLDLSIVFFSCSQGILSSTQFRAELLRTEGVQSIVLGPAGSAEMGKIVHALWEFPNWRGGQPLME